MAATHPFGLRSLGSELKGSVIEQVSLTAYRLADGRWVSFVEADGLPGPASPLVVLS